MNRTPAFLATCVLFAACGGAPAEPASPEPVADPAVPSPAPAETSPAAPEPAAPVPAAWKDKNHEQRVAYMKDSVVPKMKASFQAFDAEHFAKFGCTTCHGENGKDTGFKMPNPSLPKLDPKDGFAAELKAHPNGTKFMMEKVVPEMAELLGMQPYDPATQQGFGCFACHLPK